MVKTIPLMVVIALTGLLANTAAPVTAQSSTPTSTPPVDMSAVCRDSVEGMAALTAELTDIPENLTSEIPTRMSGDFDVNTYFDVLDHLAVQDGYIFDYVYMSDSLGGLPILYTLPEDHGPVATLAEFDQLVEGEYPDYLAHIVADGTPESYLQLAVLDLIGAQFYLYWHANYNDAQVICDQAMLDALLEASDWFGQTLTEEVKAEARALDPVPTVTIAEDEAQVRLLMFTKWGGFYALTFTISHDANRTEVAREGENLVHYDCGIMF